MALRGRLGISKVAVLTINPEEFAAAQRIFGANVPIPGTPYSVSAPSPNHEYDWVLRQATERTNQPAGEAVNDLVERLRPEYLIVVGTAGGVHGREDIMPGDVVVADFVEYSEFRKKLPGKDRPRKIAYDHPSLFLRENFAVPLCRRSDWIDLIGVPRPPMEPVVAGSSSGLRDELLQLLGLLRPAAETVADRGSPKAIEANILSGEKIWGDPTDKELDKLLKEFDKVVAVEMESYGVARAIFRQRTLARGYNPQYLVVRGISDMVNSKGNDEQRRAWTQYASSAAAAFAYCTIRDLLGSDIWQ